MKDCITVRCKNNNHNAEKAFSVTMFGFEIKIMDKCCVCGKQPQKKTVCESTVSAASAPLTYHTWTAYTLQTK